MEVPCNGNALPQLPPGMRHSGGGGDDERDLRFGIWRDTVE